MKAKTFRIDLVEQARQLRLQAEELERKVAMAKGTRDGLKPRNGFVIVKPARGPYWVGDAGDTAELMSAVWRMVLDRPYRFREIVDATGAREDRVKGVLVRLQREKREGRRVTNISDDERVALWFAPSTEVLRRIMHAKKVATDRRG